MKPIHLESKNPVLRSNLRRAHKLNETAPKYDGSVLSVHNIIEWLNVEKSARYQRTPTSTFCNIYAYDYATILGAFIPRIWWNTIAYQKVMAGENVSVVYPTKERPGTVIEMNANQLYDWFKSQSKKFGWREVNFTEGQNEANKGKCVIIVGAHINRKRSGHITCVVPETASLIAIRNNSGVIAPLQSQAGAVNFKYKAVNWQRNHEKLLCFVKD